jgi:pilus assembly protein TadC
MEKKEKKKKATKQKAEKKIRSRFDTKKTFERRRISKIFEHYLEHLSVDVHPKRLHRHIVTASIIICTLLTLTTIIAGIVLQSPVGSIIGLLIPIWTVLFAASYLAGVGVVLAYFDAQIYNRTKQIEEVLPDFLQLASANISAGMPIDRALWLAVRPRFGILAKEIEEIARSTISGDELTTGLLNFAKKYDSKLLKESMNLLVAGLESGGEIGELLDKIATNIVDTKIMKKEIGASVTTYVIFIGVASVLVAPFLFALSGQLLVIVQSIAGNLGGGSTNGSLAISFSADSIKLSDYRIFAMTLLAITTYFSASIIGVIKKGNAKEGLKNYPLFVIVALIGYVVLGWGFGLLFGGLF